MDRLGLDRWRLCAVLAAAAMLATAHAFQTFGGYAPCTLCLRQREVYWAAMVIALVALIVAQGRGARLAWLFDALLALTFLYGAGLAFYHSGVEWKWWPGPESCAATGATASAEALDALLGGAKLKPPACDEPNWWFLGLTMANWNTLVQLGLASLGAVAAVRRRRA